MRTVCWWKASWTIGFDAGRRYGIRRSCRCTRGASSRTSAGQRDCGEKKRRVVPYGSCPGVRLAGTRARECARCFGGGGGCGDRSTERFASGSPAALGRQAAADGDECARGRGAAGSGWTGASAQASRRRAGVEEGDIPLRCGGRHRRSSSGRGCAACGPGHEVGKCADDQGWRRGDAHLAVCR